ncbi:MAG: aminoglycoside phosphotransferase family protein [Rhodomicrobiaceae bacterium]
MSANAIPPPDPAIETFLISAGLLRRSEAVRFEPLAGGVSSDIWLVETRGRRLCVKRALPQLRVAAQWFAPVERSVYEAAWLDGAYRILPTAVPSILASDPASGIFAMDYLDPGTHRCWKTELLAAHVDQALAAEVGSRLAVIHAGFARDPLSPQRFATDAIFQAIRLEPYLLATARAHPDLAETLCGLAERTQASKRTVVHGDVSPKNILIGPAGPVFLDAECAWYGDPAFDLAFCLNHLLLKTIAVPAARAELLAGFSRLAQSYLPLVDWEPVRDVEQRAATLLPGLLLARIDGKSPVEYITRKQDKARVRSAARRLLTSPPQDLAALRAGWEDSTFRESG